MSGKPLNIDFYRGWTKASMALDGGRVHFRKGNSEAGETGLIYMEIHPNNLFSQLVSPNPTVLSSKRNMNGIYIRNPADVAKGGIARYGSKVARRHFESLDVRSNQIWFSELCGSPTAEQPYLTYKLTRVGDTGSNTCNNGYARYGKDAMFVSINVVGKEEKII